MHDVLKSHHQKNRPAKAPLFQTADTDDEIENSASDQVNDSSTEGENERQPSPQRASRHSKVGSRGQCNDPTQLQFYPERLQHVLSAAKLNWRLFLVMEWGFPKYRDSKGDLSGCLTRAIAAYQADGGVMDEGYFPEYKQDMVKLVSNI